MFLINPRSTNELTTNRLCICMKMDTVMIPEKAPRHKSKGVQALDMGSCHCIGNCLSNCRCEWGDCTISGKLWEITPCPSSSPSVITFSVNCKEAETGRHRQCVMSLNHAKTNNKMVWSYNCESFISKARIDIWSLKRCSALDNLNNMNRCSESSYGGRGGGEPESIRDQVERFLPDGLWNPSSTAIGKKIIWYANKNAATKENINIATVSTASPAVASPARTSFGRI